MSSSGMNSFTLTPQDVTGRSRLHFNEAASCDDFIDKCRLLDAAAAGTTGTKWIVRGLVKDPMSAAEIGEALAFDSPVEVTSFPTSTEFGTGSFLWVARCAPDRIPSIAHQHQTLERIRKVYEYSRSLNERFHHETDALLNKAANAGLRIVCNDPRNEWGRNAVDADVFTRLITNLFYYDEETAGRMLRGQGYSPLGHYLFSLKNAEGTPLCFFMIAEWPWGFEATYTMIDARYAGPATAHGSRQSLDDSGECTVHEPPRQRLTGVRRGQLLEHAPLRPVRLRVAAPGDTRWTTSGAHEHRLGRQPRRLVRRRFGRVGHPVAQVRRDRIHQLHGGSPQSRESRTLHRAGI